MHKPVRGAARWVGLGWVFWVGFRVGVLVRKKSPQNTPNNNTNWDTPFARTLTGDGHKGVTRAWYKGVHKGVHLGVPQGLTSQELLRSLPGFTQDHLGYLHMTPTHPLTHSQEPPQTPRVCCSVFSCGPHIQSASGSRAVMRACCVWSGGACWLSPGVVWAAAVQQELSRSLPGTFKEPSRSFTGACVRICFSHVYASAL